MTGRFSDRLIKNCEDKKSHLALTLRPDVKKLPEFIKKGYKSLGAALYLYNKGFIDAVCDILPAVVMPLADYEVYGISGFVAFDATVKYAKSKGMIVIADGKRGGTKEDCMAYARAYLAANDMGVSEDGSAVIEGTFSVDALTVSPYSSCEGLRDMVRFCDENSRGLFISAITTDSDKEDNFENIVCKEDEEPLYKSAIADGGFFGKNYVGDSGYSIVGLAVKSAGDAYEVRDIDSWGIILVDADEDEYFMTERYSEYFNADDGQGALICVSKRIMYAYENTEYSGKYSAETYAEAAREESVKLSKKLKSVI
ncbi:MAG: hypothetical protein IJZ94_01735 [Clostridia bacterium]|nr:hypothetical protein [Clostridia bacterium]